MPALLTVSIGGTAAAAVHVFSDPVVDTFNHGSGGVEIDMTSITTTLDTDELTFAMAWTDTIAPASDLSAPTP